MALTYRIVRAEADSDFGKIRQLYYETWQAAYRDLMPASYLQQLTPATWRPERRWQNMLLAMTADGEVVGVCTFGPARHANYEGWGELYSLYVHPNYHHHGIGQQLIIQAHRRLKAVYPQNYLLVLAIIHVGCFLLLRNQNILLLYFLFLLINNILQATNLL